MAFDSFMPAQWQQWAAGIAQGLRNVGLFLAGWFALTCVVGSAMRCCLCCRTLWAEAECDPQTLVDAFLDRDPRMLDRDSEGIALQSSGARDVEGEPSNRETTPA